MTCTRGARASTTRRRWTRWPFVLAPVLLTTLALAVGASAATAPDLGTATSFAVLAGAGITNTGATTVSGDIGSSGSSSAITGFPPGVVLFPSINHGGDAVTQGAKTALTTAYNSAAGQSVTKTISTELGGQTLVPGVYNSADGTFSLTSGILTLDGGGDPNAVFIFQMASTLTTAAGGTLAFINPTAASACNIYWQVGSSATIGAGSVFAGNILALASISMNAGAILSGRALAQTGAVTLITNTIAPSGCATLAASVRSFTATSSAGSVLLKWRTASEVEVVGYNVYAQAHGTRVRLNRTLIAAKSMTGAAYAFRYRAPKGQKASTRFWLQAVNLDGSRTWSGTAKIARRSSSWLGAR
jgi:hypothetical protein